MWTFLCPMVALTRDTLCLYNQGEKWLSSQCRKSDKNWSNSYIQSTCTSSYHEENTCKVSKQWVQNCKRSRAHKIPMLNVDGWTDECMNWRKLACLCLPAKAGVTKMVELLPLKVYPFTLKKKNNTPQSENTTIAFNSCNGITEDNKLLKYMCQTGPVCGQDSLHDTTLTIRVKLYILLMPMPKLTPTPTLYRTNSMYWDR